MDVRIIYFERNFCLKVFYLLKKILFPFTKFDKISFILDKDAYKEIKKINRLRLKKIDYN